MAILGLILGLVGLIGGILCPFVFPLIGAGEFVFVVIAVVGIVISAIGMKKKKGAATAGLVLSIIGVILSLIFAFACTMGKQAANAVSGVVSEEVAQQVGDALNEAGENLQNALNEVDVEGALNQLGDAIEGAVNEALNDGAAN